MKSVALYIICFVTLLSSCKKSFVETDPNTGQQPSTVSNNPNSDCKIQEISQVNGTTVFFNLSYQYANKTSPKEIAITEPAINNLTQKINFITQGDTIFFGTGNWMIKDAVHGQITQMQWIDADGFGNKDTIQYRYQYDASVRLAQKMSYYNGHTQPDFITDYFYSGMLLTSVKLQLGDGRKLMESSIAYDPTIVIKPWLYLYTDAFENNQLLQAFPFGVRSTSLVKQILTNIYDTQSGELLDKWNTSFSGYVISKDGYILQVNSTGDNQQGLSFLTGTLRFKYVCF